VNIFLLSLIEPKRIDEALKDVDWVNAMHEELNNFKRNQVWDSYKEQSKVGSSKLH
jgi:hypothetical protein